MADAAYHREWREKHREKLRAKERERAKHRHSDPVKRIRILERAREYYAKDPAKSMERRRIWAKLYPDRDRKYKLSANLKRYGLSFEQYVELSRKGCAICGGPSGWHGDFHFDHDHATGLFRGLLCVGCNTGLGCFKDQPTLFAAAMKYLSERK